MSRIDVLMDEKVQNEKSALLLAVYGGLEEGVNKAGGELLGLSVKFGEVDCLLTLRAVFPAGAMVGFVGGETLSDVLRKASREASRDALSWREDKWRANGG